MALCVGSFLNVVIDRVPKRVSVLRPCSHCMSCGARVANRDNIPVFSWLWLRGRCRQCRAPIGARTLLVELATAALFVAAAVRFGASWSLPAYWLFFAALLVISVIDLEHLIVPNRVLYPALAASVPLLLLAAAAGDDWGALRRAAIGGLAAFGALFLVHIVSPRGMGFGDVRLAGLIGVYEGWLGVGHIFLALFLGFVLGALVGVGLIVAGHKGRRDAIPFGPFMAAGAVIAVLWGPDLLRGYHHLFV